MRRFFCSMMFIWLPALSSFAQTSSSDTPEALRRLLLRLDRGVSHSFGEAPPGVMTRFDTAKKEMVLTLDLCGGRGPESLDQPFVDYLIQKKIPAHLFVSGRWLRHHKTDVKRLLQTGLFLFENHGLYHRPASSIPRSVFGIASTKNLRQLHEEIEGNARLIQEWTGRRPRYYRSGTAHYDNKAVLLAEALGHKALGFDVVSQDVIHRFHQKAITAQLHHARAGSIIIMHLNHRSWRGFEAFRSFADQRLQSGYRFIHLPEDPGES